MRSTLLLVLVVLLSACGGSTSPSTPAKTTAAAKPQCPPGSSNMPTDARSRMAGLQADVRKCFTLGTGGGGADVKVEVTVGESGDVREARVLGGDDQTAANDCLKKTLRSAKFSKFCGADVSISWTYALR